jgi:hypothetical protein
MPPGTASSGSGEDSQDDEYGCNQNAAPRTGPPAAIAAALAARMAAAATEAATPAKVTAAAARRVQPGEQASGHPRPHPGQTAYSRPLRQLAERSKTGPGPRKPLPRTQFQHTPLVDSVDIEKWSLALAPTYVQPPGGSEGGAEHTYVQSGTC